MTSTEQPNVSGAAATTEAPSQSNAVSSQTGPSTPDFAQLTDTSSAGENASFDRLCDVSVTVSAELGRVTLPIGKLLELGEGSVVELNRPVAALVDVVADGVLLARGEVVVVDDCFAIRIKEIESGRTA